MNSAAESLTWEFLHRGWRSLLAAAFGTASIPIITLLLLKNADALEPGGKGLETLHFVWINCEALALISASINAIGRIRRLYPFPIATSTLALWKLIPGTVSSALAFLVTAVAINQFFEIAWPVGGPALFIGASCAAVQAAIWLGGRSPLLQVTFVMLAATPLSFWLKSHYGSLLGQPVVFWEIVTAGDCAAVAGCVFLSYFVAVAALNRDRRGDSPSFAHWRERFEAWESRRRIHMAVPATPLRAQYWYEWTQKGLLLPAIVALFTTFFLLIWMWQRGTPELLREGLEGVGYGLCGVGIVIGLVFGHCGRTDGNPQLGAFLASRPLSDTSLALSILRTTGRSVIAAWLLWAVTRALLLACLAPGMFRNPTEEFWLHFGILLGAWTIAAISACASLTGRAEFCLGLILGLCGLIVCEGLFVRLFVPEEHRMTADRVLSYLDALACVALAIWLYVKALRRGLIGPLPAFIAAVLWAGFVSIGGSALVTTFVDLQKGGNLFLVALACGTALSLTPIAAAPLAVSWNRHR